MGSGNQAIFPQYVIFNYCAGNLGGVLLGMKKEKHPLKVYLRGQLLTVTWLAAQMRMSKSALYRQIDTGAPLMTRLAIETATRGGFPVSAWPDYMGADARRAYSNCGKDKE